MWQRQIEKKAPLCSEVVRNAIIVQYREDVGLLRLALERQGFRVHIVRHRYMEEELKYSHSVRGLINHSESWTKVTESGELTLVVEADFVPTEDLAFKPLPYSDPDKCWSFLYTGCARIYEIKDGVFARGHAAAPVATVIGPALAEVLIGFADHELSVNDPREYLPWDTYARVWAQKRGFPTYISYRCLGEHGGAPHPDHKKQGLHRTHRAEALSARLQFLPSYAKGSVVRYTMVRTRAKTYGFLKLFGGKFIEVSTLRNHLDDKQQLTWLVTFALKRLCSWY